jgi:nitroimidazol reductase NimA-like FMN-containing flavoprotein (pyridoxamine 5'-phosphate oxidase superfamily)
MLRKEKEITDPAEIEAIIKNAAVCRIALSDNNNPYLIPVCFGYHDRTLYFHCANAGKKLDIIRRNPNVCFEMEGEIVLLRAAQPCNWGMKYKSVIGFGKAAIIDSGQEKESALAIIMTHYSDDAGTFPEESVARTTVIKITIDALTGKRSG